MAADQCKEVPGFLVDLVDAPQLPGNIGKLLFCFGKIKVSQELVDPRTVLLDELQAVSHPAPGQVHLCLQGLDPGRFTYRDLGLKSGDLGKSLLKIRALDQLGNPLRRFIDQGTDHGAELLALRGNQLRPQLRILLQELVDGISSLPELFLLDQEINRCQGRLGLSLLRFSLL